MFSFSVRGTIVGMNGSKDGNTTFLKVKPDPVEGVRVQDGEALGNLDIQADNATLGAGVSFNQKVNVDGFGYIGQREWKPPVTAAQPNPRTKLIDNIRLVARTVKLAK